MCESFAGVRVSELCSTVSRQDVCISPLFRSPIRTNVSGGDEPYQGKEKNRKGRSTHRRLPLGGELRLLRSVILRLCSRNETFLKNARFILAPGIPRIHQVLTGCPANRIYRTAWLYRTPPLNVPLN